MSQTTDTLIIGQGIAGSLLAMQLNRMKHDFLVVDSPDKPKSSLVAAGLINPVIFRYLTLSWELERNLQAAKGCYAELSRFFGTKFFHPQPILRIFGANEYELWKRKSALPPFDTLLQPDTYEKYFDHYLAAPYGVGLVHKGGWLQMAELVKQIHAFLIQNNRLIQEDFEHKAVVVKEDGIRYKAIEARQIVFCEGAAALSNPYFDFIPFRPVKGELLTVKIPGMSDDHIINKDIYLLPVGDEMFRCGSTFDWDDLSYQPTYKARAFLEEKLREFLKLPYEVIHHQVGIRPAIADRRPVCGQHPVHNRLWILNGLGAKAALLTPFLVNELVAQLIEHKSPDATIDPVRFWKA